MDDVATECKDQERPEELHHSLVSGYIHHQREEETQASYLERSEHDVRQLHSDRGEVLT